MAALVTAVLPGSAGAAVVGSPLRAEPTGTPAACSDGAPRCADVLERVAGADVRVPAGVVTSWRLRAPLQPDVQVALRVGDAVTAPETVRGGAIETFPARLSVRAGDRLALDASRSVGATAPVAGSRHVAAGTSRDGEELLVQATVEPDADGDGYGDQTQDSCPEDRTRQVCRADVSGVDADAVPVAAAGRVATVTFTLANAGPDRAEALDAVVAARPGTSPPPSGSSPPPPGVRVTRVGDCAAARCRLPPLAAGERRTVEADVVADAEGDVALRLDAVSAADDATPPTAIGAARFVPQSVAPEPYVLPTPSCATVRRGTREDDVLEGTAFGDTLRGLEGRDLLRGAGAGDCLEGGEGSDVLAGGPGDDRLLGGVGGDRLYGDDGNDVLKGGTKNDVLFGGPGDDQLYGQSGADRLQGGAGNDLLNARDGVRERIDCGPGSDRAVVDRRDRVTACERVERK